jgi:hypothetical protein
MLTKSRFITVQGFVTEEDDVEAAIRSRNRRVVPDVGPLDDALTRRAGAKLCEILESTQERSDYIAQMCLRKTVEEGSENFFQARDTFVACVCLHYSMRDCQTDSLLELLWTGGRIFRVV